jgi:xylulose-5-phosphate/fructose-6-phosphate phosphoketolase
MLVLNRLSRFHLAISVIDRVPRLQSTSAHLRQSLADLLVQHKQFIAVHGDDMPLVKNWKWSGDRGGGL